MGDHYIEINLDDISSNQLIAIIDAARTALFDHAAAIEYLEKVDEDDACGAQEIVDSLRQALDEAGLLTTHDIEFLDDQRPKSMPAYKAEKKG